MASVVQRPGVVLGQPLETLLAAYCSHLDLALVQKLHGRELRADQPLAGWRRSPRTPARRRPPTADDLQHLGRGGLLLQRLPGLVEQAHVLDGDQRLVAERLGQRDRPWR